MRVLLLLVSAVVAAAAQKKPITLEALREIASLSPAETPGNPLAWTADGERFVYRQGQRLMLYSAASQSARELVDLNQLSAGPQRPPAPPQPFAWENRRVSEMPAQFFPDGRRLLYAQDGQLFVITDGGAALRLPVEEARDPKLSPDGRIVAFRKQWDLYTLELANLRLRRLTQGGNATIRNAGLDWVYPEELDLGTAYWWSPDSRFIAYLRFDLSGQPLYPHADLRGERAVYEPQRYPQAGDPNPDVRLGVVRAMGGATKWLEIGDTVRQYLVARVRWRPDSRELWVVRLNRQQSRMELLAFNVATRRARKVLEEADPNWVNIPEEPVFVGGGAQFLWLSERDGFRHLYLHSASGERLRQLTSGPWQVTAVHAVNEVAGTVYYTSTESSPLERHGYVIGLNGEGKRALTAPNGTHSLMVGPLAKYFLDSASSLTSPTRVTLHAGDGREIAVYREADRRVVDQYEILPTELGSFRGPDDTLLYTRLIRPAAFDPRRKYPAVVLVYGGPGAQSVRNAWYGADLDQVLAHAGFVVWQVDNRGTAGRGHAFEVPVFGNLGVAELEDQVAGVRHLISMGFVDPERVGIRGWSYGGFMALNAMLNASETFRAGAAGAPVTDWRSYDTIYTERYMGLRDQNAEGYQNTALPPRAANLKGPLLLLHNFEDDNVLFQNTLQMIDALTRAGKRYEFVLYTQKTHGVTGLESQHLNAVLLEFFERNLK